MFARNLEFIEDHDGVLKNPDLIQSIRENIQAGDVYVAKRVLDPEFTKQLRTYATQVGRNSLPNYQKIEAGCPNFHRINRWDPRAHVAGCFHQWSFFNWNQDVFQLFEKCQPVYWMKNLLSGVAADSFLNAKPDRGCVARLAIQFYPRGGGGLNRHADPVDYHQLTVPIMVMSDKGKDFSRGGAYVAKSDDDLLMIDDITEPGDVVYFNARCEHGVEKIDEDETMNWLDFQGRWMLLFAVNRVEGNDTISNSVDLEKNKTENEVS